MTVSSPTDSIVSPFAHELFIAQLAVQRAALVTKRVLAAVNASKPPPEEDPETEADDETTPCPSSIDTQTNGKSISRSLHLKDSFTSPISPVVHDTEASPYDTAIGHHTHGPNGTNAHHDTTNGHHINGTNGTTPTQDTTHGHHDNNSSEPPNPTSPTTAQLPQLSLANLPPGLLSFAKGDRTPVSLADYAAQALLVAAIHFAFPNDPIIGEESSAKLRENPMLAQMVWELVCSTRLEDEESERLLGRPGTLEEMLRLIDFAKKGDWKGKMDKEGGRCWCIDPVDGTSAFLKGGQYGISLALLEGGREVVGVLGCPNVKYDESTPVGEWKVKERKLDKNGLGLMLSAVKGQGATVRKIGTGELCEARKVDRGDGKPIDLSKVRFVDSTNSPATLTQKVEELAGLMGARYVGRVDIYASHVRYAAIALGGRNLVQLRWPKPGKGPWFTWDHAGSQLIYTESGAGKVTDLAGNPFDFSTGTQLSNSWGMITADESIHGEILKFVKEMQAAEV